MSEDSEMRKKRLNAMKYKILEAEQINLRTQEKKATEMIDTLRRIIQDEAKKVY